MEHLRSPLVSSPHLHRCGAPPRRTPPLKPWASTCALLHPMRGPCYLNRPCDHKKNKQPSRTEQKPSFSFNDASGHPQPSSVRHHRPSSNWSKQSDPAALCQETEAIVRSLSAKTTFSSAVDPLLSPRSFTPTGPETGALLVCCPSPFHPPGLLGPSSLFPVGQILGISVLTSTSLGLGDSVSRLETPFAEEQSKDESNGPSQPLTLKTSRGSSKGRKADD